MCFSPLGAPLSAEAYGSVREAHASCFEAPRFGGPKRRTKRASEIPGSAKNFTKRASKIPKRASYGAS